MWATLPPLKRVVAPLCRQIIGVDSVLCLPETQPAPPHVPPFPVIASEEQGSGSPCFWPRATTPGGRVIGGEPGATLACALDGQKASLLPNSETKETTAKSRESKVGERTPGEHVAARGLFP